MLLGKVGVDETGTGDVIGVVQLQSAAEPHARLVKLTQSPIAKSPLLIENTLFGVLGDARLEYVPRFGPGRRIENFEIHGCETAVLVLRIIHGDVQNIAAAGLLLERKLLPGHQGSGSVELFPADFVFDLGSTAGSGGPSESLFHVQFLSKIFARIPGPRPNLLDDLNVGALDDSWV